MSLRTNLRVIVVAAVLAGCGDDGADTAGTTVPTPSATPPGASPSTTPTPESTPVATPTGTPTATPTGTPAPGAPDEGGDEDGNRPEVEFALRAGAIEPARIEVPAFLGLRIRLRNESGELRAVTLDDRALAAVAPERTETIDVEGLKPGRHTLAVGAFRATIVAERAGG